MTNYFNQRVRSYWRNLWAAILRIILSVAAFIGVELTIFRKNNYTPERPAFNGRMDSAILLPVACLLETDLWERAMNQTEQSQADIGFKASPKGWPAENILYILLAIAGVLAHCSIVVRRFQHRHGEGNLVLHKWRRSHGVIPVIYWLVVL